MTLKYIITPIIVKQGSCQALTIKPQIKLTIQI